MTDPEGSSATVVVPDLTPAFVGRALTIADADAVAELVAADERALSGHSWISVEEVIGHWQRPSFDLARDSRGVFTPDGTLAGCAEVFRARRAEVTVGPNFRGRGIGAALLRWTEQLARQLGGTTVGQTVQVNNTAARTLLERHGYTERWTAWILRRPLDEEMVPEPLPTGIEIRPMASGEERVVFEIIENAFNEWPDRPPSTFADWAAMTLQRPDAQPWHVQVLSGPAGIVAAAALSVVDEDGWVDQLAVRRDHRGRGHAGALLTASFAEFRSRGVRNAVLSTDSRTGALGLYLHVGMTVAEEWIQLATTLP